MPGPLAASPNAAYIEAGTPTAYTPLPAGASALEPVMEGQLGACFSQAPGLVALLDPGGVRSDLGDGTFQLNDRATKDMLFQSLLSSATNKPTIIASDPVLNGWPSLRPSTVTSSLAYQGKTSWPRRGYDPLIAANGGLPGNMTFTWIGACARDSVNPAGNEYFFSLASGVASFMGQAAGALSFSVAGAANINTIKPAGLAAKSVLGISYDNQNNTSEIWVNGVSVSTFVHPTPINWAGSVPGSSSTCFWQYYQTASLAGKAGGSGLYNIPLARRDGSNNLVFGNAMASVMLALKAMYAF